MNISKLVLALIGTTVLQPLMAQGGSAFDAYRKSKQAQMKTYRKTKHQLFEEHRRQKNAEFAKYLSQPWEPAEEQPATPAPKKPDPVEPVVVPMDRTNPLPKAPVEVPISSVVTPTEPQKEEPLDIPLPDKPRNETGGKMNISLFGMSLPVSMTPNERFKLKSMNEKEITRIWNILMGDAYTPMFEDCARMYEEMRLNGWATYNLCKAVSETLLGKGTPEAVVLKTFLMTQLGYDARMIRLGDSHLCMICPANVELSRITYINLNGKRYYLWDKKHGEERLYQYKTNVGDATRSIDFQNGAYIRLAESMTVPRRFVSGWDATAAVTASVNKNMMDYYKDMPLITDWAFYARQSMDEGLKRQIMPVLKNAVAGKGELDAVNVLLHFVQTAFEYETDEKQYGYEKTDFKEEPFYYRACDCEDRSILLSELVNDILGLDAVLLYYPNHLCTAIRMNSNVDGDYVNVDGQKYLICDPTFINASAGKCMPQFKTAKAKIYKIF